MKLKIAILLTLIAVGLHAYLTLHYYDLNYGSTSGESVCNVSEKFNCDSVSMSQYSTLLGAPLALWGAATNIILLVLLVGW
ncbi:MAG: vitamin K epoxide reductase family protein, partial [Bdellovibrionota bacterium]